MNSQIRRALIEEASQAYYSTGTSPLSDAEFDALLEEERRENPNSPLLDVGHGYQVDKDQRAKKKFPHKYGIVGSLEKCHNYKELPKSFKEAQSVYWASLKLDGISCVMYYEKGHMYQALTRGQVVNDISVGIDITDKVKKIVPSYIDIKDKYFTGAVRGEILMSYNNFNIYKSVYPDASNARNSAAGLMGQNELSEDLKYLDIIVYNIIGHEVFHDSGIDIIHERITGKNERISTRYMEELMWLKFNYEEDHVVPHMILDFNEESFMDLMERLRDRWYGTYPADGIVITQSLMTAKNNSVIHNSVAFKFKAEVKETAVTGIEWNLSKTKYLVPTILVEPIELSGAMVSRVAGNNAKNILDSGLGVGARVKMYRSGEVIPYLDEVVEKADVELPIVCPCCGSELSWKGVHLICNNPECSDMKIQDLLIWCENIAPVEGLGDTLKLKFFEELLKDNASIESIYDSNNDHLVTFARFSSGDPQLGAQYRLFATMLNGLYNNKVPMYKALLALNIPRIGDVTAKKLAQHPDIVESLVDGCYSSADLLNIVGEATTGSILENLTKFHRLSFIWNNIDKEVSNSGEIKVAITGSLSVPRKTFETLLSANGFKLGDVTKDTRYLITDNPSSSSGKNAKADKLGIEKITEADFRNKYHLSY